MKPSYYLLVGWALMSGLVGCKQGQNEIDPTPTGRPTEVGQPQGQSISKTIGPEGGTLASVDGKVKLTLPAGALSKATSITIQPITNHAPNGVGLAYRFSPDGTQFAKRATLSFQYEKADISVNDPDVFGVAFQGSDKSWSGVSGVSVDTVARQITVSMAHFSDWSPFEMARLKWIDLEGGPVKDSYVELGASTNLEVSNPVTVVPLPETPGQGNGNNESLIIDVVKWSVVGGDANGTIRSTGTELGQGIDLYKAAYTAPRTYPPSDPITVVAEVTFKNSTKKLYLLKRILIGKDYFTGTFGGEPFNWGTLSYMRTNNVIHIAGWNESPSQSLNILLNDVSLIKPHGKYAYGKKATTGAWAEFSHSYGGFDGWVSAQYDCKALVPWVSNGEVTILQVEEVNGAEYIRGRLTGTFYNLGGYCPGAQLRNKSIEGKFRIRINQ
ncbi:hypothetical protein [Larkinella rosea]|uniref:ZU5 domain-containing protein n=1 Tax=Larkinella rosea TaxID=2025312 RepID=A0A3P1BZB1_9BACT|nr:hypothetical protein [Larkinella rosea]RRB06308.1 hypothetical protein EHT25_00435 [Larkinella rosea]